MPDVVTVFLQHGGEMLLLRRSDAGATFQGLWDGISGPETGDPRAAAERELREVVGVDDAERRRSGDPLRVVDDETGREWTIHPFLYDAPERKVYPIDGIADWEWVSPDAILDRPCAPRLWSTYRRVGPTVADVAEDEERGAADISVTALAVLRDAAAEASHVDAVADPDVQGCEAVHDVARRLRDARPEMAVVVNRINRAMATADGLDELAERARGTLRAALNADDRAAMEAAEVLADEAEESPTVVTHSRSGTALAALREADAAVVVGESRTAREGVTVAAVLADTGHEVTLTTDAALPSAVSGDVGPTPDAALVGADAVLPDGDVVNKVGTRALGLACRYAGLPLYVVAARDKIAVEDREPTESAEPAELYDGDDVAVANPVFDRTPADCIAAVITEHGRLDDEALQQTVRDHREHAGWDEQ
ncbi:MAG: NUDIX domain-containing protein [Halolamina sp.]